MSGEVGPPGCTTTAHLQGKVLKDEHRLSEYHVESGVTFHLVARQPSESQPSFGSSPGSMWKVANGMSGRVLVYRSGIWLKMCIDGLPVDQLQYMIETGIVMKKMVQEVALTAVASVAGSSHEGFFPWIDQVASILVPFLKFYFHKEVRKAVVSAMPDLLRSSKLAIEKGLAQGRDGTCLKELSDYIVPTLVEALHKELDTEKIANMLDGLSECVEISGPLLDENQVRSIVDEIKQVITAILSRKGERAERTKAEDFDAELLK